MEDMTTGASSRNPTGQRQPVFVEDAENICSPSSLDYGGESDKRRATRTAISTGLLMLALFLTALDVTIVSTAIPTISQDLRSSTGYVWIGSAYVLSNAACSPTWGKLSDIWGRKAIMLITIGIFWIGSLLCGTAANMSMLLAARAIQGVGGGGVGTLVNICIGDLYSPQERGLYYGLVGGIWGVSSAIGPLVGGVLSTKASWRWCFYINLPISGAGLVALFFLLELHNPRTPLADGLAAVDWLGTASIITATITLLLGLQFGGIAYAWKSAPVITLLLLGVVFAAVFIFIETRYAKYPIVPPWLFVGRSNIGTFITALFHSMVSVSGSYWLPLYFQATLATSAFTSGIYILPFLLGMCIVSAASGFIIRLSGNYIYIIISGMVVTTIGFGLFINLPGDKNFAKLIIYQILAGIGLGPNYQSLLIALQNNIQPSDVGSATAAYSFIRQLGTALSIVIAGVVFNNTMNRQQPELRAVLGSEMASQFAGDSAASNIAFIAKLTAEQSSTVRAAYLTSVHTMYILFLCIAGVGLMCSLLIKQQKMSRAHIVHKTGLQSLKSRQGRS